MKEKNNTIWLIVGLAVGLVIAMLGMLAYNKYVDNNEDTNNKTEDKVNNSQENIDLTGYTEIDISKNNVLPIYERYETREQRFYIDNNNILLTAKYIVENNNLFVELEDDKFEIDVDNPKKVLVGDYDSQISQPTLFILTTNGEVYTTSACSICYSETTDKMQAKNKIIDELNNELKKVSSLTQIKDISAIRFNYQEWTEEWNEIRLTYLKDNTEWVIPEMSNLESSFLLKNIEIPGIRINTEGIYDNNKNITMKYLIKYQPDLEYVIYIDTDNYLYLDNHKIENKKINKVYGKNNYIYFFELEDGSYKSIDYYYKKISDIYDLE